jgi:uncharacterized membrane protein
MLAFLLFTALLITIYGMLHKIWNKRRDKRDALEPGMYYQITYIVISELTLFAIKGPSTLRMKSLSISRISS